MAVGILCALPATVDALVVRAVERTGGRLAVARRCADLTELQAAAEAGLGRVALVDAGLAHLDRPAVAALAGAGVLVVGLTEQAAPWVGERLVAIGVEHVRPAPADAEEADDLLAVLTGLLDGSGPRPRTGPAGGGSAGSAARAPAAPATAGSPAGSAASAARRGPVTGAGPAAGPSSTATPDGLPADRRPGEAGEDRPAGRLVAVWGPTGAPGRTTVAVQLAAELALAGRTCLLVDADTYGGTVAQVLGLLDEAPGLAAAVRASAQGALDVAGLGRLAPAVVPGLRILTGISRAERWPELAAPSLDVVWTVARAMVDRVVVDCGFCLERDEALIYDTRAPQRNAATLSALAAADDVVVVGAGDPVGMQRLVRGLDALAELRVTARRTVVVNRVRASVAGPRPASAVAQALARYAGVRDVHVVPDDPAALDASLLRARLLHEVAPGSPARRAIAEVADLLGTGTVEPRREHRRVRGERRERARTASAVPGR